MRQSPNGLCTMSSESDEGFVVSLFSGPIERSDDAAHCDRWMCSLHRLSGQLTRRRRLVKEGGDVSLRGLAVWLYLHLINSGSLCGFFFPSSLMPGKFGLQRASHLSVGCPESVRPGSTLTGSLVEELQSYGAQSTNKVVLSPCVFCS